jgi:hypothetical protein
MLSVLCFDTQVPQTGWGPWKPADWWCLAFNLMKAYDNLWLWHCDIGDILIKLHLCNNQEHCFESVGASCESICWESIAIVPRNYDSKLAGYERIVYLAFAIREDTRPLARYDGTNEATQISMCFFVVSGTQLFYAKQEPHQRRLVADCRYSSQPDLKL